MKERPILFNGPMVRAILEGRKTQTRRVVKPQPGMRDVEGLFQSWVFPVKGGDALLWPNAKDKILRLCPYGQSGDRLWVRETHYRFGHWEPVPGVRTKAGRQKWRFVADDTEIFYEEPGHYRKGRHHKDPATPDFHKRLARFMPRSASRLTLEITLVRVERLQDISDRDMPNDCTAEGVYHCGMAVPDFEAWRLAGFRSAEKYMYRQLWESINGPGSWDANPWVWVIEFKRVEAAA